MQVGKVRLEALATPGHSPESISLLVFDPADPGRPHAILTGDTLLIGDVGRPDLRASLGWSAEVDQGALAVAQLQVAGEKVRVEVGEEDVLDPAAEPPGVGDVVLDVALRIDDRGAARLLVGDEVGGVGEAAEVVLLQHHRCILSPRPGERGQRGHRAGRTAVGRSGRSDGRGRQPTAIV